jgi:hypothetical protein
MGYSDGQDAVIIGWLTNESDAVREYVKVVATIKDEDGQVIGTGFTYTELRTLLPGESSPFEIRVQNVPDFNKYTIQVQSRETRSVPSRDIELLDYRGFDDSSGDFKVVGEVRNTGGDSAEYVKIICTGLNTDGGDTEIAGVGFSYTELSRIPPGQTSPFELVITDSPRSIDRFLLKVQSR